MRTVLTITEAFHGHELGSIIEDPALVARILASDDAGKVTRTEVKDLEDEAWLQSHIDRALALDFPDSVFAIVYFNQGKRDDWRIDPFVVFASSQRPEIEEWIMRSKRLLGSTSSVGETVVSKGNFEEARDDMIKHNPGFGEPSYSQAIYFGAISMR